MKKVFHMVFTAAFFYAAAYLILILGYQREPAHLLTAVPLNKGTLPEFVLPSDTVEVILLEFESANGRYRIENLEVKFYPVEREDGEVFTWRPDKISTPSGNFDPQKNMPSSDREYGWKTKASIKFRIPPEEQFYSVNLTFLVKGKVVYPAPATKESQVVLVSHPIEVVKSIVTGTEQQRIENAWLSKLLKNILYGCLVFIGSGLLAYGFIF